MSQDSTLKSLLTKEAFTLTLEQSIAQALHIINEFSISSLIIVDEHNHPIGIFTEKDALRIISEKIDVSKLIATVMTHDPFCVLESMPIHDAYLLMEEKKFRHLLVVDDSNVFLGVVTEGDFLRHLGFENFNNLKVVTDVMKSTPLMVPHDESLLNTIAIMKEKRSEYAIVIRDNFPIGIVTERDIIHNYTTAQHLENEPITTLLHDEITMISKTTSLQKAAQLMEQQNIHQLIVVDEHKKLKGILNRHDLLHAIHGAYFEFLLDVIEKKSDDIEEINELNKTLLYDRQSTFLNTIINTIPDLVWLKNSDGKYLTCNHMFERLYNAKESEIIGKTDFDFIDTKQAKFFRDNDKLAIETGGVRTNEEYLVFADGSYAGYFDTIKTPMKDKSGKIIGVLGIARDISQRKAKNKEIEKVQSLAHIGTWEWDFTDDSIIGSDETYQILGRKTTEILTLHDIFSIVYKDDKESHTNEILLTIEQKKFHEMIFRLEMEDKSIKWVKSNGEFILNSEGEISKAIGLIQDITEHVEYEQQLEHLENYDVLTGLANRDLLLKNLQSTIQEVKKHSKTFALLMFDLDRFKDVNDSFGHSVGDELLKAVSERFMLELREGDFLARLGGDEFAIVMKELHHPEDAGIFANSIIETLAQEYKLTNGEKVHIGVSVGISLFPTHSTTEETLLQHADAALYKAKEQGRGTYSYYTDELTNSARERIDYAIRLRHAVTNKEFKVYYQPQVHIETGRIIGAEALIRWDEPSEGIISPTVFIPVAEKTGLINEIGEWVLNETCRQGKIWLDKGYRLTLAVNVSAKQTLQQDIPQMVTNALNTHNYKAENLEIEITESAIMQREEEVVLMLHKLRAMGIRLAIDDFGTGYSSLSYLKRFPIDILKIDKSFVDDLPFEQDDMAIVTAIIAMGKALGFQVLAEGTEHLEQIKFLQERGCTFYQGYYKSEPVPAEEFEKLLLANQD